MQSAKISLKLKILLINFSLLVLLTVASQSQQSAVSNQQSAISHQSSVVGFGQILGESSSLAIDFASFGIQPPPYFTGSSFQPSIPDVTAASVSILDRATYTVLYEKNSRQKLPVASLTKLMTAVVALEDLPLDQAVSIGKVISGGSRMGLNEGEVITARNLLWGLLLPSGNDAAYVLVEVFNGLGLDLIGLMNQKAEFLGMRSTNFANPAGLDQADHYSTAHDLALLTDYALRFELIRQIVGTPTVAVASLDGKTTHELQNTNELLRKVEGVTGVKTGTSQGAGGSLILLVERGGHEIMIVLLGSQERWTEGKALIGWVFKNFRWE